MISRSSATSTSDSAVVGPERRFRGLVAAYAVSVYGNFLSLVALSLFTYAVTGSALGLGVLMALRLFSGVLAGIAAGTLASRFSRRVLMICADLSQAAVLLVLAWVGNDAAVWLLAVVVVVLGAGNALYNVALRTAIPVMTGHDGRVRANGLIVTARSFATVLGFASAAPIIGFGSYRLAFAINAASFVVSATAMFLLRLRTNLDESEAAAEAAESAAAEAAESTAGTGGIPLRSRLGLAGLPLLLLGMVALRGADALGSSSHNIALPVLANLTAPDNPAVVMTQFWAAWALGSLLAHQLLKRLSVRWETLLGERAFALGTCVMSLAFIVSFTGLSGPVFVVVAMVAGLADGYTEIAYTSRLQAVPDRRRGRLFGLSVTAETAGFALGMLAAAVALEGLSALVVVGVFHGVPIVGACVFLLVLSMRNRLGGTKSDEAQGKRNV